MHAAVPSFTLHRPCALATPVSSAKADRYANKPDVTTKVWQSEDAEHLVELSGKGKTSALITCRGYRYYLFIALRGAI